MVSPCKCGVALIMNSIPRFAPACKPQKSAHTGVLPVHGWIARPDSDVSRITGVLRHVAALDRRGRARRGALVIIAESVAGLIRARGRVRRQRGQVERRSPRPHTRPQACPAYPSASSPKDSDIDTTSESLFLHLICFRIAISY